PPAEIERRRHAHPPETPAHRTRSGPPRDGSRMRRGRAGGRRRRGRLRQRGPRGDRPGEPAEDRPGFRRRPEGDGRPRPLLGLDRDRRPGPRPHGPGEEGRRHGQARDGRDQQALDPRRHLRGRDPLAADPGEDQDPPRRVLIFSRICRERVSSPKVSTRIESLLVASVSRLTVTSTFFSRAVRPRTRPSIPVESEERTRTSISFRASTEAWTIFCGLPWTVASRSPLT